MRARGQVDNQTDPREARRQANLLPAPGAQNNPRPGPETIINVPKQSKRARPVIVAVPAVDSVVSVSASAVCVKWPKVARTGPGRVNLAGSGWKTESQLKPTPSGRVSGPSVWPDLAGKRNPSSNRDHPDGFRGLKRPFSVENGIPSGIF